MPVQQSARAPLALQRRRHLAHGSLCASVSWLHRPDFATEGLCQHSARQTHAQKLSCFSLTPSLPGTAISRAALMRRRTPGNAATALLVLAMPHLPLFCSCGLQQALAKPCHVTLNRGVALSPLQRGTDISVKANQLLQQAHCGAQKRRPSIYTAEEEDEDVETAPPATKQRRGGGGTRAKTRSAPSGVESGAPAAAAAGGGRGAAAARGPPDHGSSAAGGMAAAACDPGI